MPVPNEYVHFDSKTCKQQKKKFSAGAYENASWKMFIAVC